MTLVHPLLLLGLLALPPLWWLLRALPPAPRVQRFPAIRLLEGLEARTREARRAPPWLLLLRIAAATALILGLAQPVLVQDRGAAAGRGTLLLVLDDGWAAAPDWARRLQAARDALDRADARRPPGAAAADRARCRRCRAAPDPGLAAGPVARPARRSRHRCPGRSTARRRHAALLAAGAGDIGSVTYVSDGLATPGDGALARALQSMGPVSELRRRAGRAVGAGAAGAGRRAPHRPHRQPRRSRRRACCHWTARPRPVRSLAGSRSGWPPGRPRREADIVLPAELRNQLARLVLDGVPGPGGIRLLDEGDRRRPIGLLGGAGADTPLLGSLFYLRRALAPISELREGTPEQLLSRQLSVLVAPDGTLESPADRARIAAWVRHGGILIRFAGPLLAARAAEPAGDGTDAGPPDDDADAAAAADAEATPPQPQPQPQPQPRPALSNPLLPVKLLAGTRELGGAMSWSHPEHPAAFPAGSPFAGLAVPDEVTVSRQVLARPSADLAASSWARLADGTPLVTHATLGDGQLVLFHVTSNADWSNLPLSGLFPAMLQRLVQRSVGLSSPGDRTVLSPVETLGGDGVLGPPPPAAQGLAADAFGRTPASPTHPAGLYGPAASRRSLNLADALPPLAPAAAFGALRSLADRVPDRPLGPALLALSLLLLAIDLLATMAVRGLVRGPVRRRRTRAGIAAGVLALLATGMAWPGAGPARAVEAVAPPAPLETVPPAALETRLAYVVTGDEGVDAVSREGLQGLSSYANARTSAQLGQPEGVVPGRDDLSFYPMIYWPVTPATVPAVPAPAWTAALASYMGHGGILLIDTQGIDPSADQGAGQGTDPAPSDTATAGFTLDVPGTRAALRRATAGLDIPSLHPVDGQHVLSHSFYLLHAFPGRYVGTPVWVARADDLGNDGVSPVIIGANDWAAAWAVDDTGQTPFAVIPSGDDQRTLAYRFGVNAVIYALTGNYKTDQVHVPALLQRLGE